MKIVKIEYPTALWQIDDIYNDNIDVFVTLEDGNTYVMVVTTPLYMLSYMDKEGLDYLPAAPPEVILRSLTAENIRKAIESFAEEDAYWMKLHVLLHRVPMECLNAELDAIRASNEENKHLAFEVDEAERIHQEPLQRFKAGLARGDLNTCNQAIADLVERGFEMTNLQRSVNYYEQEVMFQMRKELALSHEALEKCIWAYVYERTMDKTFPLAQDDFEELVDLLLVEDWKEVERLFAMLLQRRDLTEEQTQRLLACEGLTSVQETHRVNGIEDKLMAREKLTDEEVRHLIKLDFVVHLNKAVKRGLLETSLYSAFLTPQFTSAVRLDVDRWELYQTATKSHR